jgi:hypothetical protein
MLFLKTLATTVVRISWLNNADLLRPDILPGVPYFLA